ncbi:MAG: PspA/IM30 family protein [Burkholderiales bacterium]|nr:PspA/IM30 family protein [Burkholderiales bacterium]
MVRSHLNSAVLRLSNPEKMMRLLIQDMEDTLGKVRVSAVRAIAERRELERRIGHTKEEIDSWAHKAEVAVLKDRNDLAVAALQAKARSTLMLQTLEQQLATLSHSLLQQNADMEKLQARLQEAKARERTVSTLHGTAKSRLKMRRHLFDHRVDNALLQFERLENCLDDIEGKVESYDLGQNRQLSEALGQLTIESTSTTELAELQLRLANNPTPLALESAKA